MTKKQPLFRDKKEPEKTPIGWRVRYIAVKDFKSLFDESRDCCKKGGVFFRGNFFLRLENAEKRVREFPNYHSLGLWKPYIEPIFSRDQLLPEETEEDDL